MKKTLFFCILLFTMFSLVSCSDDDKDKNDLRIEIHGDEGWDRVNTLSVPIGNTIRIRIINTPNNGTFQIGAENTEMVSVDPFFGVEGWSVKGLIIGKTVIKVQTSDNKLLQIPIEVLPKTSNFSTQDSFIQIEGVNETEKNEIQAEIEKTFIPSYSKIALTFTTSDEGGIIIDKKKEDKNVYYNGAFVIMQTETILQLKVFIDKEEYIYDILKSISLPATDELREVGPRKVYLVNDFTAKYKSKYPALTTAKIIITGYFW